MSEFQKNWRPVRSLDLICWSCTGSGFLESYQTNHAANGGLYGESSLAVCRCCRGSGVIDFNLKKKSHEEK